MCYAQVSYHIEPNLKQSSDHISFIVNLPITPENICIYRIVLKYDSKEEVVFFLSISKGLSQLNFCTLNSVTSLNSLSKAISRLFDNY